MGWKLPDFDPVLPVFGTIGLILIVLEGALELELNKSKIGLIVTSSMGALWPMFGLAFILAAMFHYVGDYSIKASLTNALPFCVISSAIAIPSVKDLSSSDRSFVIYESSFSEIFGVMLFNFVALNTVFNWFTFGNFWLQIVIISAVSFLATVALAFLLSKIEHQIKFVPIILLVILIFSVSKVYHLPALVFILMFGLFLGNLDELKGLRWIQRLKPELLDREVHKFKDLLSEAVFLIKALFFLLFGYLIEAAELFNGFTLMWSVVIVACMFLLRAIQLKLSRLPLRPFLFVAPRGLITILLFLSIAPGQKIPLVNKPLIIQVIVLTTLLMMFGLMNTHKHRKKKSKDTLISGSDSEWEELEMAIKTPPDSDYRTTVD
jgi:hypothetical protein